MKSALADLDIRPRLVALAVIRGYQRFISPHKGFRCAYRCYTGHASCSMLGYRAVRRHGVMAGLGILRKRAHRCGIAYRMHRQGGFCDFVDIGSCAFDAASQAVCCPCDLLPVEDKSSTERRATKKARETRIGMPPKSGEY